MPINFNILNPIQTSKPIGQLPGQDDGGIGGLMSGIQGLIGGVSKATGFQGNGGTLGGFVNGMINPVRPNQNSLQNSLQNTTTLKSPSFETPDSLKVSDKPYMDLASRFVGTNEGEGHQVLSSFFQKSLGQNINPQTTPWCAAFVNGVLKQSGLPVTNSLAAKSLLNYGTRSDQPTKGDIVVFNDMSGKNDPARGHVGFVQSIDMQKGVVSVLGGNQNNSVSVKQYPLNMVAGFRKPPTPQEIQKFNQVASSRIPPQEQAALRNETHADLNPTVAGIVNVESGGSKNPYTSISIPSKNGDRAYGYSQIMGANIPSWTREALGHPLTPQQYLSNPEAQVQTTQYHVNKLLQQGYSPQEVGSIWFSGRTTDKAGNAKDAYGTSVSQYLEKFNKGYLKARSDSEVPASSRKPSFTLNDEPSKSMPSELVPFAPPVLQDPNQPLKPFAPGLPVLRSANAANQQGINWGLLQALNQQDDKST